MGFWQSLFGGGGNDEQLQKLELPQSLGAISAELESLPPEEARYLAAFAFVLGRVAYADLEISSRERQAMERIVAKLGKLGNQQARLVVELVAHQQELTGGTDNYLVTRELRRMATREQLIELLHCLFAVSAADDDISHTEESTIRVIATELGFATSDYVAVRRTYNDKRSVVKQLRATTGSLLLVLGLVSACGTTTQTSNVLLNLVIAGAAAGKRYSDGECPVPCIHGTRCNLERRVCERLPCGQECAPSEECDELHVPPRCVPAGLVGLGLRRHTSLDGGVTQALPAAPLTSESPAPPQPAASGSSASPH